MRKFVGITGAVAASALALTGCGASASSSDGDAGLAGETIELVVPFDPGGGYDQYARQLAPALAEQLDAEVVVVNKPGAGGLLATNELWRAEPDGTQIALFNTTGHLGAALAGADGVQYEAEKFSYIGRISSEPDVVVTAPGAGFDKVLGSGGSVRFSATGPGSNEYIDPLVLQSVLGLDAEIVTGYGGSDEALLAVLSGDVDAYSRSLSSQMPAIDGGEVEPVLVVGNEAVEAFSDVPTMLDIAESDEQRAVLEAHANLIESGRTIGGPPGMDEAVLEELRDAFEAAVTDEEYMAAAEKFGRPINFASGAEVQKMIEDLMNAPEEYVAVLKQGFSAAE
jgi:tripartite-type tricarboxylate transporter receptor subunit TctC